MKNLFKRLGAIAMIFAILCSMMVVGVNAATSETAVIDDSRTGSITLYKYDMTAAIENEDWDDSFVSTGLPDAAVEQLYAPYAIEGVEYTYLRVADVITHTDETNTGKTVRVLYGFDYDTVSNTLLDALALDDGDSYFMDDNDVMWFESDTLNYALASNLITRETETKNALEELVTDNGGTAMPETNENGRSSVDDLDLGLYLIVETRVPENVTNTTAPFFVSLPMTTIDGDDWNYAVTIYPKNLTGEPTLSKAVRESADDTGKNDGSTDDITDGYSGYTSASEGDVVEYQVISKLPTITSDATKLSVYTFVDTLSKGIEYNKNDVKIEWFTDEECTDLLATWTENDATAKFTVAYGTAANDATTMTVTMTAAGLNEINTSTAVYASSPLYRGYSDLYLRITYAATLNSSADTVLGKDGNPNSVTLTWQRTNTEYWDTLTSNAKVYTFGIELTKTFSDGEGDPTEVEFIVHNDTDDYWLVAEYDEDDEVYYVTGHAEDEEDATHFIPYTDSHIVIKGVEDDTYSMTEIATDDGYVLLTEPIEVSFTYVITRAPSNMRVLATVNDTSVTAIADNGSAVAIIPLTVVNTKGFDLPQTGDNGVWMYGAVGIALMAGALIAIIVATGKKKSERC